MSYKIRIATQSDIDAVMHIIKRCRDHLHSREVMTWSDAYPTTDVLMNDIMEGFVFLASPEGDDENIIGTISLTPNMYERALYEISWQTDTEKYLEIARLAVLPEYHGTGLGRRLLDHTMRFAIRHHAESLRLEVYCSETQLIEMYERRGFKPLGSVREEGRDYVVMEFLTPEIRTVISSPETDHQQEVIEACHAIRREVFIIGQDVPEEIDLDGKDESFDHIILEFGDEHAGCVRLNTSNPGIVKIERLAVLGKFRGYGFGQHLVQAVIDECRKRSLDSIVMNAQYYLKDFYAAFGFEAEGEVFLEADIEHVRMVMEL